MTDTEEDLLVDAVVAAVLAEDSTHALALRAVAAKLVHYQPSVELRVAYRIAARVRDSLNFIPRDHTNTNGATHHDN